MLIVQFFNVIFWYPPYNASTAGKTGDWFLDVQQFHPSREARRQLSKDGWTLRCQVILSGAGCIHSG